MRTKPVSKLALYPNLKRLLPLRSPSSAPLVPHVFVVLVILSRLQTAWSGTRSHVPACNTMQSARHEEQAKEDKGTAESGYRELGIYMFKQGRRGQQGLTLRGVITNQGREGLD